MTLDVMMTIQMVGSSKTKRPEPLHVASLFFWGIVLHQQDANRAGQHVGAPVQLASTLITWDCPVVALAHGLAVVHVTYW